MRRTKSAIFVQEGGDPATAIANQPHEEVDEFVSLRKKTAARGGRQQREEEDSHWSCTAEGLLRARVEGEDCRRRVTVSWRCRCCHHCELEEEETKLPRVGEVSLEEEEERSWSHTEEEECRRRSCTSYYRRHIAVSYRGHELEEEEESLPREEEGIERRKELEQRMNGGGVRCRRAFAMKKMEVVVVAQGRR